MSDEKPTEEMHEKIMQAVQEGRIGFECVFCHDVVERNVSALILVTNWDGPEDDQSSQQWFCHAACFIEKTGAVPYSMETN